MTESITRIGTLLMGQDALLATAESCTGGLVGHLLTSVPGSSRWYVGGMISYSNSLKQGVLGVREETMESVGAVSAEVARQMALGARQAFETQYAISVTGIAGPGGGTEEKPVGLTYIGVATPDTVIARRYHWQGSREANKQSSADAALTLLLTMLENEAEQDSERLPPHEPSAAVEARFELDGRIRPLSFMWKGRAIRVTDWGRQWVDEERDRHYLVMSGDNRVWELCFSPATLHWSIQPRSAARQLA